MLHKQYESAVLASFTSKQTTLVGDILLFGKTMLKFPCDGSLFSCEVGDSHLICVFKYKGINLTRFLLYIFFLFLSPLRNSKLSQKQVAMHLEIPFLTDKQSAFIKTESTQYFETILSDTCEYDYNARIKTLVSMKSQICIITIWKLPVCFVFPGASL